MLQGQPFKYYQGSVKGEGYAWTQHQHIHTAQTSLFPLVARSLGLQVTSCPNGQVSAIFSVHIFHKPKV